MKRWQTVLLVAAAMGSLAILGQERITRAAAPEPAPQIQTPRSSAGKGLTAEGGSVRINPAAVRSYVTGSASLAHGVIAGNGGCSSQSIAVPGAVLGDKVVIGPPAELLTYSLAMTYAVSTPDSVTIRLCNYTPTSITTPSWTWNVDVIKSF